MEVISSVFWESSLRMVGVILSEERLEMGVFWYVLLTSLLLFLLLLLFISSVIDVVLILVVIILFWFVSVG